MDEVGNKWAGVGPAAANGFDFGPGDGTKFFAPEESNEQYAKATRQKDEKPQPLRGVLHRFPRAILALAECSRVGTKKRGIPLDDMSFADDPTSCTRYGEALVRHLLAEAIEGMVNSDPADQGMCHDVQAAWDVLARLETRLVQEERKCA